MTAAVISLTERGRLLSERIAESGVCECGRFCFFKHTDPKAESFSDIGQLTERLFGEYDALIFVCACGIAVRAIAPHIRSKLTDPAVVATDDSGRFAVPLLSGHIGGANALARRLAEVTGAQAAVTTATDSGGLFSPDCFAAANGLNITDMAAAKEIAAAVLDGEKIGLMTDCECLNIPPEITRGAARCGIYIGSEDVHPFEVTLSLVPKDLVLGIGCRKGISADSIAEAVESAGIDTARIYTVASIDRKLGERGLTEFCKRLGVPFVTFSADELKAVGGDFGHSEFVEKITGVDNVCERSAAAVSGGEIVIKKTASNGVTAAAAVRKTVIDFAKEQRR
ncbi:cobalt-precorrin 5A hydrolase [Ruminococcus sp. YE71]|uniref:cobalt-precorrin 5A hydrolase n=1 Tax=unclassified Ruminococcus TaxID=2608920 RepID=UPI00088DBC7D|nr:MULTISPECIES: cobalt-precorrin 5A hydrolase [unclassified Ruminococcus]SDA14383.1 cobalt-precorrin 5A hydrolase [Ruminococcus sp. YE78]SFW20952.1 cobalt-precorrin 5A hydrolase [Ruminococcus sp. YE71]